MPQSGIMTIFCLIGIFTIIYFVGGFLDVVTDYYPNFILWVIGAGIAVYAIASWTGAAIQARRRRRQRSA